MDLEAAGCLTKDVQDVMENLFGRAYFSTFHSLVDESSQVVHNRDLLGSRRKCACRGFWKVQLIVFGIHFSIIIAIHFYFHDEADVNLMRSQIVLFTTFL